MNKTDLKKIISGYEDRRHVHNHLEIQDNVEVVKIIRNALKR
jgi:hypothetical protein